MSDASNDRPPKRLRTRTLVWMCLGVLALILAPFIWMGVEIILVYADEPAADTDYRAKLTEMCESLQPAEGENGWAELVEIARLVSRVGDEAEKAARNAPPPQTKEMSFEEVADWIWRQEQDAQLAALEEPETLAALRRALNRPRLIHGLASNDQPLLNELATELTPMAALRRPLTALVRKRAEAQDWEGFLDAVELNLRHGQAMARQPEPMFNLIGQATSGLAVKELITLLGEMEMPPAVTSRVETLMREHGPPEPAYSIEVKRLFVLDTLQWTHGLRGRALPLETVVDLDVAPWQDGFVQGIHPDRDKRTMGRATKSAWRLATHDACIDFANDWFDAFLEHVQAPADERSGATWPTEERKASLDDPSLQVLRRALSLWVELGQMIDVSEINRSALRVMLAIERHQADHDGEPPAELGELVPFYIDDLPLDPMNGQSFGYRVLEDDEHGRAFLLYTYGPDGVDNDGREDPEAEWYFAPAGHDFILNRVRDE